MISMGTALRVLADELIELCEEETDEIGDMACKI
jgi:hypothetical protein